MANFEGFPIKAEIPRWGSLCQWDDPVRLPLGVAATVRNMRFSEETTASRWGLLRALVTGNASPITGGALLKFKGNEATDVPEKFALIYDQAGNLLRESPPGSKILVPVVSNLLVAGNYAGRMQSAYDRCWIPQSNLIEGTAEPLVFDGRNKDLQRVSFKPWGVPWEKNTIYRVGMFVSPTVENGLIYRCKVAGTSGNAEPAWPTGAYSTVNDNGITWEEATPFAGTEVPVPAPTILARIGGGGAFAAGRDVYVKVTISNGLGETDITSQAYDVIANTVLNDGVQVPQPTRPSWYADLAAPYAITGWNVYEADVANGSAAPAAGAYKKANVWAIDTAVRAGGVVTIKTVSPHGFGVGSPVSIAGVTDGSFNGNFTVAGIVDAYHFTYVQAGADTASGSGTADGPISFTFASLTITGAATGTAAPIENTAYLAGAGNICAGKRWMVWLAELTNGYIIGISDAMPVQADVSQAGRSIFCARAPIGPANTKRRIAAFTVAGDSRGGRYFYAPEDDKLYPGDVEAGAAVEITKTVIEDNVTTHVVFNFPDTYLTDLPTEVTEYFDKAEVPFCSDIYFSKALNRMVYTGCVGFPSGHLVSDEADPETVRLPGSEIEVAEKDGDRTVCWREVGDTQYSLKENSGHIVDPGNEPNPQNWAVRQAWTGSGWCGPMAGDCTDRFMVYWHTSGPYLMQNEPPVWLGPELFNEDPEHPGVIQRVNIAAKHTIWCYIDQQAHEINFGLPLDGATKPNYRLRLKVRDWSQLQAEPVVLARSGGVVANTFGRRWSLDPMNVNFMFAPERDLAAPVNNQVDHRQVLYASGENNGLLRYQCPGALHDEDATGTAVPIDWAWTGVKNERAGFILGFGGATVSARGSGKLRVLAVPLSGDPIDLTAKRPCDLDSVPKYFDLIGRGLYSERWGMSFEVDRDADGNPVLDCWAELQTATGYLKAAYQARRG